MAYFLFLSVCKCFNHSTYKNPLADTNSGFDLTYIFNLLSTQYPIWFPSSMMSTIIINSLSLHIVELTCYWIQREPIENTEHYMLIN